MVVGVGKPPTQLEAEAITERVGVAIHRPPNPWRKRLIWAIAVVVALAIGLLLTPGFPEKLVVNVAKVFDGFQEWVIANQKTSPLFIYILNPIKDVAQALLDGTTNVLNRMTYLGVIVGAASLAGILAGWRLAIVTAVGFSVMGLLGLWESSVETLALITVSVGPALLIGIPLGIWTGRNNRAEAFLRPLLDAMQTVPAFAYLLPLVLLFGIGAATAIIATLIFALPPAVRLTSLGIRGVPPTALEVAGSFGSTRRQTLRKVQLPMAKPSIMLGVNQTIMMAMGMIVIAAIVAAPGLGRDVLNALQQLNIGEALNAGIAIVALAIVLDRVSYAWSLRDRRLKPTIDLLGRSFTRRQAAILGAVVTVAAVFIGREVLRQQVWPESLTVSVAAPANHALDWMQTTFSGVTNAMSDWLIKFALDPLRDLLMGEPWWVIVGGTALLAWRLSRRASLAVFCGGCVLAIGVLGMWDLAMDTLSQVLVAVVLSILIAIPLGVASALSDRFQQGLKPVLDAMQTMPAFVYLVPVIFLFQLGRVPGVIASVIYALPPAIRLTDLGIRQVPKEIVEAAQAYGSTPRQLLLKVQLPLARPSIMLGVNQTIMMALSVVIIAGLIGAGALGFEVVYDLTHTEIGRGLVAGVTITLLAIVLDRLTQAMGMERRATRGPVGTGGVGWWTRVRAIPDTSARAGQGSSDVTQDENSRKGEG
jgi:glycine betaine/proline transport system permease protein